MKAKEFFRKCRQKMQPASLGDGKSPWFIETHCGSQIPCQEALPYTPNSDSGPHHLPCRPFSSHSNLSLTQKPAHPIGPSASSSLTHWQTHLHGQSMVAQSA